MHHGMPAFFTGQISDLISKKSQNAVFIEGWCKTICLTSSNKQNFWILTSAVLIS